MTIGRLKGARFARGLVVGKFSPLHRGHQHLIEAALAACESLIVLSYSNPEFPCCRGREREQWLAALYPQVRRIVFGAGATHTSPLPIVANDASDEAQRQFVCEVLEHSKSGPIDAVFTSEDYGPGFARHLEAYQAQQHGTAPSVAHVCVDRGRLTVPISGTEIRRDPHAARVWLDPIVYAAFVARIGLLGGESSGKSTLAIALAREFHTQSVAEFGRDFWIERDGQLVFDDLEFIGRQQVRMEEEAARRASRYLFCDTTPLTTQLYSEVLFGRSSAGLQRLAERPYDFTVLCAPDFAFVQDGWRRDAAFRDEQHRWYERELARRQCPHLVVHGDVAARVEQVKAWLRSASGSSDCA